MINLCGTFQRNELTADHLALGLQNFQMLAQVFNGYNSTL